MPNVDKRKNGNLMQSSLMSLLSSFSCRVVLRRRRNVYNPVCNDLFWPVTDRSGILSMFLPSLVLRMTLMISVGSRVSSSACWAMYCSTHCTWGQSDTYTQVRNHGHETHTNTCCSIAVVLTPVLINHFIFLSVWVGGVGESRHPPVHVWPVDKNSFEVLSIRNL